jgi:hypothetical protein
MAISNYLADATLNHVYRNTALTSPTTVYVALFTTATGDDGSGTECTGTDYAREAATFGAPGNEGGNRGISNSAIVDFGTDSDGTFGTISHFAIFDAATNGNMLDHGALDASKTPSAGDPVSFAIGELTITRA